MLRFCSLGSGSSGNATLVEARSGTTVTRLLIDCGLSLRELDARLALLGLAAGDLDAVFVTHEHSDHVGAAAALARRHRLPVWASQGTWLACREDLGPHWHPARDGEAIALGDLHLLPYTVPHDAREPLQLVCGDGRARLGVLTDAGTHTPHLLQQLAGCEALILECNHDPELLRRSRYPAFLKTRIAGPHGHLSNETAHEILRSCRHGRLRHVVAAHLSEENNRPALAAAALAAALGAEPDDIVVADASRGFGWLEV